VGDVHGMAQTWGNLGAVYMQKGEWDKAIEFYQKSLSVTERLGDVVTSANNYFGLGMLYERQNEPRKAMDFVEKAMQIWKQIGSPYAAQYAEYVARLRGKLGG